MSDRDKNRFLVRMPDGMRDRIAEIAAANSRSMNSEIVLRLEKSLISEQLVPEFSDEQAQKIATRVAALLREKD